MMEEIKLTETEGKVITSQNTTERTLDSNGVSRSNSFIIRKREKDLTWEDTIAAMNSFLDTKDETIIKAV